MPTYNEITLAKELMRFPSITPIDAGVMKFLAKKLTAIGFKRNAFSQDDKGFITHIIPPKEIPPVAISQLKIGKILRGRGRIVNRTRPCNSRKPH